MITTGHIIAFIMGGTFMFVGLLLWVLWDAKALEEAYRKQW